MTTHDIPAIKARLDPASVVEKYAHQEARPKKHIRCPSQYHADRNPSCMMDYHTGLWKCFGCGAAGDILDFIAYTLFPDYNIDSRPHFAELLDMLAGIRLVAQHPAPAPQGKEIKLTLDRYAHHLNAWTDNLLHDAPLMAWLEDRGVTEDGIVRFKLGLSQRGDDLYDGYADRLIIPNVYRGVLVAIKYRSRPGVPKVYKHFKDSIGSIPFNADALNQRHDVVLLMETGLDAVALSEFYADGVICISIPANGFTLAHAKLFGLTKHVIMIGDNDEPGRQAVAKAQRLLRRLIPAFPPAQFKDPGEVFQASASLDWITSRIRLARRDYG